MSESELKLKEVLDNYIIPSITKEMNNISDKIKSLDEKFDKKLFSITHEINKNKKFRIFVYGAFSVISVLITSVIIPLTFFYLNNI